MKRSPLLKLAWIWWEQALLPSENTSPKQSLIRTFAIEIEVVPARVAAEITKQVSILTISLGSGLECDATYLFSADLLGENRGHIPRHAKVYRNFAAEHDRLHKERVAAYGEYIADIKNQSYPQDEHSVSIKDDEFDAFINGIK